MNNQRVLVNDLMQTGYIYVLVESIGQGYHAGFQPELTPIKMLELGAFGGKYMTDCTAEFPGVGLRTPSCVTNDKLQA